MTSYNGDEDVNDLELPNGQKIQLNVPGDQIFLGSGTSSVFGALNALVADYSSGTVNTAQAVSDTEALSTALNYVSQQRVTIDNSMTQLTAASGAVTQRADAADGRADQPDAGGHSDGFDAAFARPRRSRRRLKM